MQILIYSLLLEGYAAILTMLQVMIGVRTDEAKYLLNIPYPHPPLARFFFSLFDGLSFQEILIRFLIASLVVQAAWLFRLLARDRRPSVEILLPLLWLASSAVIHQGATVMIAVVNALEGLVLLWFSLMLDRRPDRSVVETPHGASLQRTASPRPAASVQGTLPQMIFRRIGSLSDDRIFFLVGLFWLASIFTGYQVVLYLPIVWVIFQKSSYRLFDRLLFVFGPILLLALYSLNNPLALARIVGTANKDQSLTLLMRFLNYGDLWIHAGSLILSIVGTIGIIRSKRMDLLGAFLLTSLYIFASNSDYYAILLTPLLVVGLLFLPLWSKEMDRWIYGIMLGICLLISPLALPNGPSSVARDVVRALIERGIDVRHENILIHGAFGHEWQYEFGGEVLKDSSSLQDPRADVVVCFEACPADRVVGLQKMVVRGVEVYVR